MIKKDFIRKTQVVICGALILTQLGLTGCSSSPRGVQVVDRTQNARPMTTSGQYQVRPGDTLYSIAFRFGWDWKALAAKNGIYDPYVIKPGQIIRFSGGATTQPRPAVVANTRPATTTGTVAVPQPSQAPLQTSSSPSTSTSAAKPAKTTSTVVTAPPKKAEEKPAQTVVSSAPVSAPSVNTGAVSAKGWRWPASGQVVSKFSSAQKGIDIAGRSGEPILAASAGTVVYAGSGLVGYGELIIIKHNDVYLSAYGHNRRILVKEGQAVKSGQQIAEMGSTGTDTTKLHFEIRRQGNSVDPVPYLPKR